MSEDNTSERERERAEHEQTTHTGRRPDETTQHRDECPKCEGEARFIDGRGPFCRDCGWSPGIYGGENRVL